MKAKLEAKDTTKDLERADEINRDLKSFMDNWEKIPYL